MLQYPYKNSPPKKKRICRYCKCEFQPIFKYQYFCTEKRRFWAKVAKSTDDKCWEWTGTKDTCGYGLFKPTGTRSCVHANRKAYEYTFGKVTDTIKILHKCDNPACCNPMHLVAGTQLDNMHDCLKKGRLTTRKLTISEIRYIRQRKMSTNKMAVKFNVHPETIRRIIVGHTYNVF